MNKNSQVKEKRKILILSLGSGQKNEEKNYPYRIANYRLNEEEVCLESPFVADVLIKNVQPDSIIIVGTVKSAWDAFYHWNLWKKKDTIPNFAQIWEDNWKPTWEEIEKEISCKSKDTCDDELDNFQKKINDIYDKELKIEGNSKLDVCMIRYGLNEEELRDSYGRISRCLRNTLNRYEEDDIDISFDITHSFRSMPIYNLAVIDYCRLLSEQNIKIDHVFYGNLDVAKENNNIAQIVDLKNIVNILEVTRGINEFNNTGNAATFLNWYDSIHNEEDEFITSLREFNGAMHMNNRRVLQDSLAKLLSYQVEGDRTALLDAKATIQDQLRKEIPVLGNHNVKTKEEQLSNAKFQLALSKWCFKHDQIGVAAAIAKEALKSYLVTVYDITEITKYEDDETRRDVEYKFHKKTREKSANKVLKRYSEIEKKARDIRNTFAHNLDIQGKDNVNFQEDKKIIKDYIKLIQSIMRMKKDYLVSHNDNHLEVPKADNIVVYITNRVTGVEEIKKSIHNGVIFLLKINTKINGEKLQNLSRIITWKLEELCNLCIENQRIQVIWGEEVKPFIYRNVSQLIFSSRIADRIEITRWYSGKMENVYDNNIWKIDIEKELSEDKKDELIDELKNHSFKKIYESKEKY